MERLDVNEIELVSGGMNWQGGRLSMNVIDCRSEIACYDMFGNVALSETLSLNPFGFTFGYPAGGGVNFGFRFPVMMR
jgi:hypothetical protein